MTQQDKDDRRSLIVAEIMTPEKANFAGNIHGGHLLQMFDKAAYACAARYSQHYVVTLSVDQVVFKQPIHLGELVTCYASINYVGRTSMEVGIKVIAENLETGETRHTNSCYFTMIALNKQGKPIPVEPLELRNETEKQRHAEALSRKEIAMLISKGHEKRKEMIKKKLI